MKIRKLSDYFLRLAVISSLLVPSCLFGKSLYEPTGKVDSFELEIRNMPDGLTKIYKLTDHVIDLDVSQNEEALECAKMAMEISRKINSETGLAYATNAMGVVYMNAADISNSLEYFNKALEINKKLNNPEFDAQIIGNIGLVYDMKSDYPKALEYLFSSLKISESIGDKESMGNQYGNIGNVYQEFKKPMEALHYDSLALKIFTEIEDKGAMALQIGNMANILSDLNQNERAIELYFKAISIYRNLKQKEGVARNFNNIAAAYEGLGQLDSSVKYYTISLEIYQSYESIPGMQLTYGNIGGAYFKKFTELNEKNFNHPFLKTALLNFEKAIEYGKIAVNYPNEIYYRDLYAQALEYSGRYKDALQQYRVSAQLRDSVFNMESKTKIEELTTEREMMLRQKQIEINKLELEKKRDREVLLMSGIILSLVLAVFIYKNYQKQKRLNIDLQIEKNKSDELLLNILPSDIATELKSKGNSEAKQYNNVTVLFTDFVNFTGISEQMTPKQLVEEIHKNFTAFDAIIEKNGLEKIKTIGDAYLAVCGLPNETPDHAWKVVNTAIEIRDYMSGHEDNRFKLRIGIHSGPVVAGIVGVKKFAYDIWGDTVNTASRMESSGEVGKVNISGTTYELVKDKFNCIHRGKISAKGKGEIDMYFVD